MSKDYTLEYRTRLVDNTPRQITLGKGWAKKCPSFFTIRTYKVHTSTTYSLPKEVLQNLLSIFDLKTLHSTLVQTRVLQKKTFYLAFLYFFLHTVILSDRTLKKWALSSFAFQSFYVFIETLNKKILLIPMRDF